MSTLKAFIEQSNIDATLIRSVVRQMGGWNEFKNNAADIYNHGCISGAASGFIYYTETVPFARRHKKAILIELDYLANGLGETSLDILQGFKLLKCYSLNEIATALYTGKGGAVTDVFNALAWFIVEEICGDYINYTEDK